MIIPTSTLKHMLEQHKLWLETYGTAGERFIYHGDLSGADLSFADLSSADLRDAILRDVNLQNANLCDTNLNNADLCGADLSGAELYSCSMVGASLTNTEGLVSQEDCMNETFEKTEAGYIVYKIFGLVYNPNPNWVIAAGSIIEEPECCMDRRDPCNRGINVTTIDYLYNVIDSAFYNITNTKYRPIWKCLIRHEWLDGVCVPYGAPNHIRCKKLELIEII